jgi:hypothetical protein
VESREAVCEGCDQKKTVPLIDIGDGIKWEGLCEECQKNYGMQAGDIIHLTKPLESHPDEIEVRFVQPEIDAIRISFLSDGFTEVIPWTGFHRPQTG